jgi:hypothetical protein
MNLKPQKSRALATLAAAQAAAADFDSAVKTAEEARSQAPAGSERDEIEVQLASYREKRLYLVNPGAEK